MKIPVGVDFDQIAEVYEIFDRDFKIIYVGRGVSARRRFVIFCRKHPEEAFGYRVVAKFPLTFACETELTLIDLHRPKYNKLRASSLGAYGVTTTTGDRNGARLHTESMARGDQNGSRLHPESLARGDRHGSKTCPESVARGDRNGSRTCPEKVPRGGKHGTKTHPESVARGERVGGAKLTEEGVRYIRMWVGEGFSQRKIAEAFGVSQGSVAHILNGNIWKHVK